MPHKTKRQLQIKAIIKERKESEIDENWIECENIDDWTNKDLNKFEKIGRKLITEVLCWHKNTTSSIRATYNGTSRTTVWRNKKKKEELAYDIKRMRTLDTLFKGTKVLTSIPF
ncbi:hypothetical protein RCL_jg18699.t1 [Rhizophagus clarus]|uniref:Uncharacterized protein n=1 Tax=Rhizophagus clarus TaxID=94130 RepID=A0A8H3LJI1_9GLOM|nr:hypothetical protein RCL_jg18699.t1 [Rhizophagus clarus]